jgi:hypothetical protein
VIDLSVIFVTVPEKICADGAGFFDWVVAGSCQDCSANGANIPSQISIAQKRRENRSTVFRI